MSQEIKLPELPMPPGRVWVPGHTYGYSTHTTAQLELYAREYGRQCAEAAYVDGHGRGVWAGTQAEAMDRERLIEAARLEEREACARLCDERRDFYRAGGFWHEYFAARRLGDAIRARGNT